MAAAPLLHFEDLHPGLTLTSRILVITEADILAFAQDFDPQPMHVDQEQAAAGPLAGLIASGWHTALLATHLQRETGLPATGLVEIASLAWPIPVRPGDSLHVEIEIRSTGPAPDHPGHGLVQFQNIVRNGRGEAVAIMQGAVLVPRQSQATERIRGSAARDDPHTGASNI